MHGHGHRGSAVPWWSALRPCSSETPTPTPTDLPTRFRRQGWNAARRAACRGYSVPPARMRRGAYIERAPRSTRGAPAGASAVCRSRAIPHPNKTTKQQPCSGSPACAPRHPGGPGSRARHRWQGPARDTSAERRAGWGRGWGGGVRDGIATLRRRTSHTLLAHLGVRVAGVDQRRLQLLAGLAERSVHHGHGRGPRRPGRHKKQKKAHSPHQEGVLPHDSWLTKITTTTHVMRRGLP